MQFRRRRAVPPLLSAAAGGTGGAVAAFVAAAAAAMAMTLSLASASRGGTIVRTAAAYQYSAIYAQPFRIGGGAATARTNRRHRHFAFGSCFCESVSTTMRHSKPPCKQSDPPFGVRSGRIRLRPSSRCCSSKTATTLFASPSPSAYDGGSSAATDATGASDSENVPIMLRGLNPSQVEAVTQPLEAITRVVAGPGSGKTRVLTCRIAHILLSPSSSDEDNGGRNNNHRGGGRRNNYNNERVLAVTFTRKAAGEMQKRLRDLLLEHQEQQQQRQQSSSNEADALVNVEEEDGGDPYPKELYRVTLGTFHSICAKILRWNGDLLGTLPSVSRDMVGSQNATFLDGSFAIVDESEQLRIVRECLEDANIDLNRVGIKVRPVLTAIADCRAAAARGEDPFKNVTAWRNGSGGRNGDKKPPSRAMEVASKVYYKYREKLLARNCLDFDDLIYFARELLMEYGDVQERLQRRWPHVLVDEFQDTSRTQLDLVKLLTSNSLFVVGDADQSIYSWRGAHVGSLSDFEDEFQHILGGVETIYLMENYRSTSNIVRAAQKVISHKAGSDSSSSSGADRLRKDMKPKRGSGKAPMIVSFENDKAEADFAVTTVKQALMAGNYSANHSVAFIYRTNAQSRALEEACVKHNLPYVIFGSATSFYKRQEIKDCLCFLRWLHNGRDRTAMLRAMSTPKRGIGDVAVQEFDNYCAAVEAYYEKEFPGRAPPSSLDILISLSGDGLMFLDSDAPFPSDSLSKRPMKLLTEFSTQMRSIRDRANEEPLENVLSAVIAELGIFRHLDKISKSVAEFEERKQNVRELQQATVAYTNHGPCLATSIKAEVGGEGEESGADKGTTFRESPLGNFLDDVALVTDLAERSSEERFVVNLMTAHASKGMEFDTVFVLGNEDGTFPTSQALNEEEGSSKLEEEKRLCYVAMTRAKSELLLTWRREVSIFTPEGIRTVERGRSRFLDILAGNKGKNSKSLKPGLKSTKAGIKPSTSDVYHGNAKNTRFPSEFTPPSKRKGEDGPRPSRSAGWQKGAARRRDYSTAASPSYDTFTENRPKLASSRSVGTNSVYASNRGTNQRRQLPLEEPTTRRNSYSKEVPRTGRVNVRAILDATSTAGAAAEPGMGTNNYKRNGVAAHQQRNLPPATNSRIGQTGERRRTAKRRTQGEATAAAAAAPDSTWFFPVGSHVVHKKLGKGTVLPPPPPGAADQQDQQQLRMLVHVEFENGERHRFPAAGSDIAPAFLR